MHHSEEDITVTHIMENDMHFYDMLLIKPDASEKEIRSQQEMLCRRLVHSLPNRMTALDRHRREQAAKRLEKSLEILLDKEQRPFFDYQIAEYRKLRPRSALGITSERVLRSQIRKERMETLRFRFIISFITLVLFSLLYLKDAIILVALLYGWGQAMLGASVVLLLSIAGSFKFMDSLYMVDRLQNAGPFEFFVRT